MYLIYAFNFLHWIRIQVCTQENQEGSKLTVFLSPHIEAVVISSFNSYSSKVLKSRFMVTGPDSLVSPSSFLLLLWHEAAGEAALLYRSAVHSVQAHIHPMYCVWKKTQFDEKCEETPHLIRLLPGLWLNVELWNTNGLDSTLCH